MNKIPFALQPFDVNSTDRLGIAISGNLSLNKNNIEIHYQLLGNIHEVFFSQLSQAPSRKDMLWESTCFELFVARPESQSYWEYNLSPSQDWAIFRFTDYRENKTNELSISSIGIKTRIDNGKQFELNSSLPLPDSLMGHSLQLGVSAVIQNSQGDIYYYAMNHQNQQPDFHDRNSFTIKIEN